MKHFLPHFENVLRYGVQFLVSSSRNFSTSTFSPAIRPGTIEALTE